MPFVLGFPNKECTRWTYFFSAPDCALVHRQNRWTYEWRWCFDRNCAVGVLRWPVVFCMGGGLLRWSFARAVVFCGGVLHGRRSFAVVFFKRPPQKTTAHAKDHRIGRCRRRPDAAAANALGPQPRIMGVSHVGHGYARCHARLVFSSSNKAPHLTRNHQPHAPSVNRCVHRFRNSVRAREWRAIQEPTLGAVS